MADDFKYHIDHHSSFVPPIELTDAHTAHEQGLLDDEGLRAAEDTAIADIVLMQRRLGLSALSDGEFRRRTWLSPVFDGIGGFTAEAGTTVPFAELVGPLHAPEVHRLDGLPQEHGRLVKEEADVLVSSTDRSTMIALPAPGFVAELTAGEGDLVAAGTELAQILQQEIVSLLADGVRHVLVRNPAYGFLLTTVGRSQAAAVGLDPDLLLRRMLSIDSQVVDGLEVPPECRVSLDISTTGAVMGPYDSAASRVFSADLPYTRVCVEFPLEPDQRFPIDGLAEGTVVSLGIVDLGAAALEDVDDLVGLVDEAASVLDVDNIALSTNGGFHASRLSHTPDQERAKLQLVEMAARYIWGNEL